MDRTLYRTRCGVLTGLLMLAGGCGEPPGDDAPLADLSTWDRVGDDPWRFTETGVEAGPAEVTGFLVSTESFDDFRLTLEYWVQDDTNSGIHIRCTSRESIGPDACYEINIWDNHPNQASRTGSVVTIAEPAAHIEGLERWVPVEIVAEGKRLRALFDGKLTVDLEHERSLGGAIALQYAGTGKLRFRKLVIEAL